ncbi:MAG TPA: hypothetical protein VJK51_03790 [Candidatus Nanoarchaeia archaeon]|nr:hypothetical protein [Candidatus Nanoarchaeia archaeon]
MSRTEKIALSVFVVSLIIFCFLLVSLFVQRTSVGLVVSDEQEEVREEVLSAGGTCADSDGKNYGVRGSVRFCEGEICSDYVDGCSGTLLTEWYCDDGVQSVSYGCSLMCSLGACVDAVTRFSSSGSGSSSGGGGGGSSGDSVGSSSVSGQTFALGALDSEQTLELAVADVMQFAVLGTTYSLSLSSKTPSEAVFFSGSQSYSITVGTSQDLDLNGVGGREVTLKVKSINVITNKVKVILTP